MKQYALIYVDQPAIPSVTCQDLTVAIHVSASPATLKLLTSFVSRFLSVREFSSEMKATVVECVKFLTSSEF